MARVKQTALKSTGGAGGSAGGGAGGSAGGRGVTSFGGVKLPAAAPPDVQVYAPLGGPYTLAEIMALVAYAGQRDLTDSHNLVIASIQVRERLAHVLTNKRAATAIRANFLDAFKIILESPLYEATADAADDMGLDDASAHHIETIWPNIMEAFGKNIVSAADISTNLLSLVDAVAGAEAQEDAIGQRMNIFNCQATVHFKFLNGRTWGGGFAESTETFNRGKACAANVIRAIGTDEDFHYFLEAPVDGEFDLLMDAVEARVVDLVDILEDASWACRSLADRAAIKDAAKNALKGLPDAYAVDFGASDDDDDDDGGAAGGAAAASAGGLAAGGGAAFASDLDGLLAELDQPAAALFAQTAGPVGSSGVSIGLRAFKYTPGKLPRMVAPTEAPAAPAKLPAAWPKDYASGLLDDDIEDISDDERAHSAGPAARSKLRRLMEGAAASGGAGGGAAAGAASAALAQLLATQPVTAPEASYGILGRFAELPAKLPAAGLPASAFTTPARRLTRANALGGSGLPSGGRLRSLMASFERPTLARSATLDWPPVDTADAAAGGSAAAAPAAAPAAAGGSAAAAPAALSRTATLEAPAAAGSAARWLRAIVREDGRPFLYTDLEHAGPEATPDVLARATALHVNGGLAGAATTALTVLVVNGHAAYATNNAKAALDAIVQIQAAGDQPAVFTADINQPYKPIGLAALARLAGAKRPRA